MTAIFINCLVALGAGALGFALGGFVFRRPVGSNPVNYLGRSSDHGPAQPRNGGGPGAGRSGPR